MCATSYTESYVAASTRRPPLVVAEGLAERLRPNSSLEREPNRALRSSLRAIGVRSSPMQTQLQSPGKHAVSKTAATRPARCHVQGVGCRRDELRATYQFWR